MRLENAKDRAQFFADKEGKTHLVLNLNRYSPRYVVREGEPRGTDDEVFVATPKKKEV